MTDDSTDELVSLQFEFLDHGLTLKAEEEVVCCQRRHRIPGSIGRAGDMWEDDCGTRELIYDRREVSRVELME